MPQVFSDAHEIPCSHMLVLDVTWGLAPGATHTYVRTSVSPEQTSFRLAGRQPPDGKTRSGGQGLLVLPLLFLVKQTK